MKTSIVKVKKTIEIPKIKSRKDQFIEHVYIIQNNYRRKMEALYGIYPEFIVKP